MEWILCGEQRSSTKKASTYEEVEAFLSVRNALADFFPRYAGNPVCEDDLRWTFFCAAAETLPSAPAKGYAWSFAPFFCLRLEDRTFFDVGVEFFSLGNSGLEVVQA